MRRSLRLVALVTALAAVAALAALAASPALASEKMWVGFHDDPSYRWSSSRQIRIKRSAADGATIVRLLVQWNRVAPRRPRRPASPFDRVYRFDDVDEAVRAAQQRGQEAMLTISGTPRWAGGGKPNRMPRRVRDFQLFAQAIAARYSGRFPGFPFVRFWSVWNEPNLNRFLTPQFDRRGRSVAPRNYARLYAAGYAGIKAGNPLAKVAIGETSARGRDRHVRGFSDTHSPGRFARLVAKTNPRLTFDAWAQHPYPATPSSRPGQVVRWPNVSLATLPRLVKRLNRWFGRRSTKIWVTEYGYRTRPEDSFGIPYATQAAYVWQAITIARRKPFVGMFIWFVYQDDRRGPWHSGLYTQAGAPKGRSPASFRAVAVRVDPRNAVISSRRGTKRPKVRLLVRRYCANDPPGTRIGMTWRVFDKRKLIAVGQRSAPLRRDCTIVTWLRLQHAVPRGKRYTATFALNDRNGIFVHRRITIRGTA